MSAVAEQLAAACLACGEEAGYRTFILRERMFGTLAPFEYLECGACGSLRIGAVPADLDRHYPSAYHAYEPPRSSGIFLRTLKRLRGEHEFGGGSRLGALVARAAGRTFYYDWLCRSGSRLDSRVLDAGCGSGHLLFTMRDAGFRDLTGVDPFLPPEVESGPGLRFRRCSLESMDGTYDLVMMHHAFEHAPDPLSTLRAVRRLLAPAGRALIRIPVAGAYAWRAYGEFWAQLDAPRHLHLETERGFVSLAGRAGLEVEEVVYDSGGFQFWASELYRRGVPLRDLATGGVVVLGDHFSAAELREYDRRAAELNRQGDGDAAAYYLRTPTAFPANEPAR